MKFGNMITMQSFLATLRRSVRMLFDEADAIEWAGEALTGIDAYTMYEQAVAFVEVKDHMAPIPARLDSIIQIARNNCWQEEPSTCTPAAAVQAATETACDGIPIDCCGLPLTSYDVAYYRPYFDLIYNYHGWASSTLYEACYTPVGLSNHSFFNSLVEPQTDPIYQSCTDEYNIKHPYLVFSFASGYVAIAYHRVKLGEDGFPMIPDDYSYIQAVSAYIKYKLAGIKFDNNEPGSDRMLAKYEKDWHWYCAQASVKSFLAITPDEQQNKIDRNMQMIPKQHRYYGFFGNLNTPELRNWQNDQRHSSY